MEHRQIYRFPFSRYPAVRNALLLISGILIARNEPVQWQWSVVLLMGLSLILMVVEWANRKKVNLGLSRFGAILFLLILASFGVFRMSWHQHKQNDIVSGMIELSPWEDIEVSAQITSISKTAAAKERWNVAVNRISLSSLNIKKDMKLRVLADEVAQQATLGDSVFFSGMIIPISGKRNPSDFDYKEYLQSQGIKAQVKLQALEKITPNKNKLQWVWWREQMLKLIERNFSKATAPVAKALLAGYKQDLESKSKTAFARAGLSHIMAVSGLHVGFIVAPFWVIIPWFWSRKYGRQLGLVLLILLLYSYAGITGFSPSVMRASVMAGFLTYGKLFHKVHDSINLTAAAAIVLLIINPADLFNIGFQLSFSAVLIILLILPVIQRTLPYWVRIRWYGQPLMVVIVSLVVQFGLYPLQVYYFGEISLVSPLANALFVPLLGVVVPLSLLSLGFTAFWPAAGFALNYPSYWFLEGMFHFVHTAAEWQWAWTTASLPNMLLFLFWVLLIGMVAAFQIAALRWRLLNLLVFSACLMVGVQVYKKMQPASFRVLYFDVGQGDAALVQTPSGNNMLIDAGAWSPGYNSGKSVILPHLRANGIDELDAVVLSHPHADHIGGILDIMDGISIKKIYNSGFEYSSKLYQNYLVKAEEKQIPVSSLHAGDTLLIDPTMMLLVYGPDGKTYNSDPNEHSLVLELIYGETEFLFTGDAGTEQEERLLDAFGKLLDTDVLKVGHHGSRTSSGMEFLQTATPDKAIISLAERNKFRHPHRQAVNRLGSTKADLLFTSRERAIILESDGKNIHRVNWE